MSFPQFNSFPPEIHAIILEQCPPNDLTCLRLTCKYLYNFFPEKLSQRIDLECDDTGPLCYQEVGKDWSSRFQHKQQCHKLSYEKICALNEAKGRSTPPMKKCRTGSGYGPPHCECFTRRNRLHFRLNSWIGGGLRYCGVCSRFTKRKRQHKGRCYHGKSKPYNRQCNFWTHSSRRGAFGRKIWKMWFNNEAMNSLEARLIRGAPERKGSARYAMRSLEGKHVNTRIERDSK